MNHINTKSSSSEPIQPKSNGIKQIPRNYIKMKQYKSSNTTKSIRPKKINQIQTKSSNPKQINQIQRKSFRFKENQSNPKKINQNRKATKSKQNQ